MPAIPLEWSPIAHYGGYQQHETGTRQGKGLLDAVAESEDQHAWRERNGEMPPHAVHAGHGGCF